MYIIKYITPLLVVAGIILATMALSEFVSHWFLILLAGVPVYSICKLHNIKEQEARKVKKIDLTNFFELNKEEQQQLFELARQIPANQPNKFYDEAEKLGFHLTLNAYTCVYEIVNN